jgi:iron complex transport system permease protein
VLFQGLFRNPLADPFVLGASGGAALGGAVAVFLVPALSFAGVGAIELLAFAGSLLAMAIVWNLAKAGGRFAVENMLLAGFAIGTMLNAATAALELRQEATNSGMRILAAWLHGEVTVPSWTQLSVVAILEVVALIAALPLARQLNTLALSEEYAAQLGVRVERLQILVVITGSILTALAVSLGGLIGFVGLLVPHFLRLIFGPDHFRLLPSAALSGAVFLIVADTIARTAFAPTEIPVGMLTAFLGGPAFLYLLNHRQRSTSL